MKKVSVIIASHNRPDMLKVAISSVLSQSYKDIEIIVVDDASTVSIEPVIDLFSCKANIKFLFLDKNTGSSAIPRNEGIKRTNGEYVTFLDDDDWLSPICIEYLVKKMDSCDKRVGMVYCGQYNVTNGKTRERTHYHLSGYLLKEQLGYMISSVPGTLIRRECFDKVGLFDEGNVTPHYDMWIRLAKEYEWDYIEEYLAYFLNHDDSHSRKRGMWKPIYGILQKHIEDFEKYPESKVAIYRTLMLHYRNDNKWKEFWYTGLKSNPHHRFADYLLMFIVGISPKLPKLITPIYTSLYELIPSFLKVKKPYSEMPEERM